MSASNLVISIDPSFQPQAMMFLMKQPLRKCSREKEEFLCSSGSQRLSSKFQNVPFPVSISRTEVKILSVGRYYFLPSLRGRPYSSKLPPAMHVLMIPLCYLFLNQQIFTQCLVSVRYYKMLKMCWRSCITGIIIS